MEPTRPCPKCGSHDRGLWLGSEEYNKPWKLVCNSCGLEQWFDSGERAYSEWFQVDENGMIHFNDTPSIAIDLYKVGD